MAAESWQTAEVPGPTKALVITKPEVVVAMLKKAKRPILVVGHEAVDIDAGNEKLIDFTIRLAKTGHIPVVATAHIVGEFIKKGFPPAAWMPAVDIGNRLQDASWKGVDAKGTYDLLLILGLPYALEWLILSGLKNFASSLKLISLDRYYQPHAAWSFPNISLETWKENLSLITEKLRG